MKFAKINNYLFFQISKYFFLILFIFLSVSWLLQITRLFTITNFMHIQIFDVIFLSLYLIPNLITVIIPFILIFGLLLCFLKLNKDNELIAILSLGLGLKPFKSTLVLFGSIIIIFFILLNFYFAPKIYEKYKIEEYNLRNTLDFNNMVFSNFLNLNNNTVIDFKKNNNNEYNDLFISFNDGKENIVFAKKGKIFSKNNKYNFQLTNGFKVSIDNNKQIEKLEFLNYILKIDNQNINITKIDDKNTFTIYDDLKNYDYLNILFKFVDIFLLIYILVLFYNNNLKKINFTNMNNIYFSLLCIIILIINQILKNTDINILNYSLIISGVILSSLIIFYIKNKYEQN